MNFDSSCSLPRVRSGNTGTVVDNYRRSRKQLFVTDGKVAVGMFLEGADRTGWVEVLFKFRAALRRLGERGTKER